MEFFATTLRTPYCESWDTFMQQHHMKTCGKNVQILRVLHFRSLFSYRLHTWNRIYILTWFFVLKLLEQSSAYKSHVILSNFQGSEPRFEWYSLSTSWFQKKFCVINFYFDIHFCQNYNWRIVYNARVTRSMTTRTKSFGFFWDCLTNTGYICPKTLKSCFKCQNEKKQSSNFNRFWKLTHTKWFVFKTWFWSLEIGQNYIGNVCWRLLQKFQNEKPC